MREDSALLTSSNPNYLPKVLLLNTITLGGSFNRRIWGEHKYSVYNKLSFVKKKKIWIIKERWTQIPNSLLEFVVRRKTMLLTKQCLSVALWLYECVSPYINTIINAFKNKWEGSYAQAFRNTASMAALFTLRTLLFTTPLPLILDACFHRLMTQDSLYFN